MSWMVWLYIINTIFLLIIAIREVRRPTKALNWITIGLLLPVVGFGLYLTTTNPRRLRHQRLTSPHNRSDKLPETLGGSASLIAHALRHFTVHGLQTGRVRVLTNGIETYEKLSESIRNARRTIDLEYFLFRDDQIGRQIMDLLIERAAANVRVRFVRDGWGSRKFPRTQFLRMMDAGIECRTCFPVRFPWILSNWNYRNHCKIVVIDGKEAFTGGINVGYEYTGLKPKVGFWRDTHVRIEGEAAVDLQTVFDEHWNIASPERMSKKTIRNTGDEDARKRALDPTATYNVALPRTILSDLSTEWGAAQLGTKDRTGVDHDAGIESSHQAYIQTLEGNPGIPTQIIRQAYFICLTQASQTVDITTPYFVPDADIIMAIKTAAVRGVRVRLLVPRHSDQKIADLASRTFYGELLEAGVDIYLYNKGMLHAKLMIIDGSVSVIGAANYDMRSFRYEYNVCEMLYSEDVARELTEQFERDLTDSVPLRIEDLRQRSLPQRILEQGARLLSPML
jgi:cardiolipin synthase A/B